MNITINCQTLQNLLNFWIANHRDFNPDDEIAFDVIENKEKLQISIHYPYAYFIQNALIMRIDNIMKVLGYAPASIAFDGAYGSIIVLEYVTK